MVLKTAFLMVHAVSQAHLATLDFVRPPQKDAGIHPF
jgi:hypothetical protein